MSGGSHSPLTYARCLLDRMPSPTTATPTNSCDAYDYEDHQRSYSNAALIDRWERRFW